MADLSHLCRVCAKHVTSPAVSLLEKGYIKSDAGYMKFDAMNIFNLQIDPSNGLPTNICQKCFEIINTWVSLKHTCELSQQYFSRMLRVTKSRQHPTQLLPGPEIKLNTVGNVGQTLFNPKISVQTPERIGNICAENNQKKSATVADLWYTNPESQVPVKAAVCGENSTENSNFCDNPVQTQKSYSGIINLCPENSIHKNSELIVQRHVTGNLNICSEESAPDTPVVVAQTSENSTGIGNMRFNNTASTCSAVKVSSPENSTRETTKNLADNKGINKSKSKKRELRVMLERIDVKKYMSELQKMKQIDTNDDNFIDPNMEQFVLDSEVQETADVDEPEDISEIFLEATNNSEMNFYTEDTVVENPEPVNIINDLTETNASHIVKNRKFCEICSKTFFSLERHLHQNHSNILSSSQIKALVDEDNLSRRTCSVCKLVLSRTDALRNHMLKAHSVPKYKCQECEAVKMLNLGTMNANSLHFTFGSLATHIASKHPTANFNKLIDECINENNHSKNIFACRECGEIFDSQLLLTYHAAELHNKISEPKLGQFEEINLEQEVEVKNEITVDEIDWSSVPLEATENETAPQSTKKSVLLALLESGSSQQDNQLSPCLQTTQTENDTSQHQDSASNNFQLYQCLTCKQLFRNISSYFEHGNKVHGANREHCLKSSKYFSDPSSLKEHVNDVHSFVGSTNLFACHICGKKFKLKRYRQTHIRRVHKVKAYSY